MDIQEEYKKYNYPSKQKLYALTKLEGVKATLKEVQQYTKLCPEQSHSASQVFCPKNGQKVGQKMCTKKWTKIWK